MIKNSFKYKQLNKNQYYLGGELILNKKLIKELYLFLYFIDIYIYIFFYFYIKYISLNLFIFLDIF
jgi:hypothetical protein